MESKSNGSRIRKSKQFTGLLGQKEARMADFPPKRIIMIELKIRLRAGEIKGFCIQPTFILAPNLKYKADFIVFNNDDTSEIIDVKGMKTKEYIVKKKVSEDKFNLKIKEV